MKATDLKAELFTQLAEPFTGEALFDSLPDVVFFIKNSRGEYVVVNETLVARCGRREKAELIGRQVDEFFAPPLGESYREQDDRVLRDGHPILNQLELHSYPSGVRGWCVTNKHPLRDTAGKIAGLFGTSRDLQSANEKSDGYASIAKVVQHVRANFATPLKVCALAASAGLSDYQFEQRMRRIFHITAGQFILKARMDAAVRLLRETDDSIVSIALDCGYSDQSAFSRQFRQTTGISPSQYRRTFQHRS